MRRHAAWIVLAIAVVAGGRILAQQPGPAPVIRTDISGEWAVVSKRRPAASRARAGSWRLHRSAAERRRSQKAESWDASILSQPERQSQAHPVQYLMRGPRPGASHSEGRRPHHAGAHCVHDRRRLSAAPIASSG